MEFSHTKEVVPAKFSRVKGGDGCVVARTAKSIYFPALCGMLRESGM